MAYYTKLNRASITELLQQQYGIEEVLDHRVLKGGSQNTNYWVKTFNRAFVLTICEQKSLKKTKDLAKLLVYLNANGFSTSQVIPTIEGKLATVFEGKPVLLKAFIEGDIIEDLSAEQLVALGKQLAQLHQIPPPDYLPKSLSYGIEQFDSVQLYAPESDFYVWLKDMQAYIEVFLSKELVKTLIHSDIFFNNIIVHPHKEQTTIMDFEEAVHYYRLFDIGMMMVGTCREGTHLNLAKIQSILRGYQQISPLLDVEKRALQAFIVYGAVATAYWRHQHFNHVKVISEMKNHYRVMQDLANHVKVMELKLSEKI